MIEQLKVYNIKSPKIRLGNQSDGGYVIPEVFLYESAAIFGYGVGTDIGFELDYTARTNKPSFLFDNTCNPPQIPEKYKELMKYKKENLSHEKNNDCDTFFSHLEQSGINKPVILKMDIEGFEFDFFKNIDIKLLSEKVIGIIVEFHPLNDTAKLEDFFRIIKELNNYFYVNHVHGNNYAGALTYTEYGQDFIVPHVIELTLVNKIILSNLNINGKYDVSIDTDDYPNPNLDRKGNRWDKPEHDLNFLKFIRNIITNNDVGLNIKNVTEKNAPEKNNLNTFEKSVDQVTSLTNKISPDEEMIYISLTTVPARINLWSSFSQNLQSLLNQKTDKNYRVLLNIPYKYSNNNNEEYILPNQLLELANQNSKLIINRINKDYGPVVKITGVLQYTKNINNVLIVCDDDHYYHEDMLEYHLKKMEQYPNSIICFRGDNPIEKREWEENGVIKYTLKPTHFYFPVKHDSQLIIPGHWHSVGYKRGYFGDDFLNEEFLNLSTNDDILSGYYFRLKKIPFVCAKWDNETDWRAVNDNGRQAGSFPIKFPLPYPESGFSEFRKQANHQNGKTSQIIYDTLTLNHDQIYVEPIKTYSTSKKVIEQIKTSSTSKKVIVTLTTLPTRLNQKHDTGIKSNLYSLLNQEYDGEYEIHFNVPKILKYTNTEYVIPDWLRTISQENPKFKIFENLDDYGPSTKLVPTLLRVNDDDAIIIVCDDDLVYHPKMVAEHVKNQEKFENTAIGYDGSRLVNPNDFDDVRNHFVVSVYKDVYVKILQHYKTVSYKRSFFKQDFFDEFIGDSWNDDILISAYMGKHGIKKLVKCYEDEEKLITIEQWREKGGVTTFPVIRHTSHDGMEGCGLYRRDSLDDKHMKYINLGYI